MTGKDRTGMISMFVLSVLGATRQEILDDYIASNLAL
jgi:protein tyrosine/serine phosphatase